MLTRLHTLRHDQAHDSGEYGTWEEDERQKEGKKNPHLELGSRRIVTDQQVRHASTCELGAKVRDAHSAKAAG